MLKILKSNKGLTLIELIVSIAILGIIIIPLSSYFINSIRINKIAQYRLEANHIAQQMMEEIKSQRTVIQTVYEGTEINEGDYNITKIIRPLSDYQIIQNNNNNADINFSYDANIEVNENDLKFDTDTTSNLISNIADNTNVEIKVERGSGNSIQIRYNNSFNKTINKSDNEINIVIKQNSNKNIIFNTYSTNIITNFYIVKSKGANGAIRINTKSGKVKFLDNIYDKTIIKDEKTWIYKISIIVKRKGIELVKIVGLKKVD